MFKTKIENLYNKYAYRAVCYAEDLIGDGNGKYKKEIAIDYLISKLPLYLKPFSGIIRSVFNDIADTLIEKAVEKLHSVQEQVKSRLES